MASPDPFIGREILNGEFQLLEKIGTGGMGSVYRANQTANTGANGVLLDLSVVEIVDSFLGRMLNDIAVGVRLLGAQMVVVGIQPAVAITLVELGLELKGVRTTGSPDRGLALLRRLVNAERLAWGRNDGRGNTRAHD